MEEVIICADVAFLRIIWYNECKAFIIIIQMPLQMCRFLICSLHIGLLYRTERKKNQKLVNMSLVEPRLFINDELEANGGLKLYQIVKPVIMGC